MAWTLGAVSTVLTMCYLKGATLPLQTKFLLSTPIKGILSFCWPHLCGCILVSAYRCSGWRYVASNTSGPSSGPAPSVPCRGAAWPGLMERLRGGILVTPVRGGGPALLPASRALCSRTHPCRSPNYSQRDWFLWGKQNKTYSYFRMMKLKATWKVDQNR